MQEPILRATHYILELVQLQKQMFEFCNYRMDRKEAARLSVCEYITSLKSGEWWYKYLPVHVLLHVETAYAIIIMIITLTRAREEPIL